MNDSLSPKPIEPESWLGSPEHDDPALAQLTGLPVVVRLLVALFMVLVAMLVALLGLVLMTIDHWLARLLVIGVVESLALFLFLAALYCLIPASSLGRALAFVYRRAKVAVWLVMSAAALATVVGLALATWHWFTGQR